MQNEIEETYDSMTLGLRMVDEWDAVSADEALQRHIRFKTTLGLLLIDSLQLRLKWREWCYCCLRWNFKLLPFQCLTHFIELNPGLAKLIIYHQFLTEAPVMNKGWRHSLH